VRFCHWCWRCGFAEIAAHAVACYCCPCIATLLLPINRERLPSVLQAGGYDWVAITSPEAATVFLEGWRDAGAPEVSTPAGIQQQQTAYSSRHDRAGTTSSSSVGNKVVCSAAAVAIGTDGAHTQQQHRHQGPASNRCRSHCRAAAAEVCIHVMMPVRLLVCSHLPCVCASLPVTVCAPLVCRCVLQWWGQAQGRCWRQLAYHPPSLRQR
jgi:hypothetical protein